MLLVVKPLPSRVRQGLNSSGARQPVGSGRRRLSWPHSLPLVPFGAPGDSGGSVGGSVVDEAVAHVLCRPSLLRAATRKAYRVAARSPVTSMLFEAVDRSTAGVAAASEANDSVYPMR